MATTTLAAVQGAKDAAQADLDAEIAMLAAAVVTPKGLLGVVAGYVDGDAATAQAAVATSEAKIARLSQRIAMLASLEVTQSGGTITTA